MRKRAPTDDAVRLVRGLSGTNKLLLWLAGTIVAIGTVLTSFNAGVRYVADRLVSDRFHQYEEDRKKGEQERRERYRADTKQAMKDLDQRVDALEREVDRLKIKDGEGRRR